MQTKNKELQTIEEFYDEFSKKQVATGVNLRHYYLFRKIVSSGLKKNHSVLEIGCGIATLTGLLSKYIKKGDILAVDISPENIEVAKKRLHNQQNVKFLVSDMKDFNYPEKFDYVILADVLEHIPIDLHESIFKVISMHLTANGVVFINIPHPKNIEFTREKFPEKLQIIDQALYAETLTKAASNSGLILTSYTAYSLFSLQHDYIRMMFKKNMRINYTPITKSKIIIKKFTNRIYYWVSRI